MHQDKNSEKGKPNQPLKAEAKGRAWPNFSLTAASRGFAKANLDVCGHHNGGNNINNV